MAIFIVVTLSFVIVNVIPSDPAHVKAGDLASPSVVAEIRHQLGLDRPFFTRYWDYLRGVLHGDLGRSYYSGRPVWSDIWLYLPSTIELIVFALIVAVLIGIAVGTVSALFWSRMPDRLARSFVTVTQAVPDFFLGLIFIFVFFSRLHWAPPPTGQLDIIDPTPPGVTHALMIDSLIHGDWAIFRSALSHAVLPVLALGIVYSAYFAKATRSALKRALDSHQVEFARACGLREREVLAYAFRAVRTPIMTYGGILFSGLVGGAAIVETVFSWNGIGQFEIDRILHFDIPEIQGFIMVAGLITLLVYLALDILVVLTDPRVSYG